MAFCQNCGTELTNDAAFCQNCGVPAHKEQQSAQPQPQPQPQPQYNYVPQPRYTAAPATPAIAVLKKVASSPLCLTGIIAFTLTLVLNLINAMSVGNIINTIIGNLYNLAYSLDSYELYEMLEMITPYINGGLISSGAGIVSFFSMLPSILIAVGLWLIFAAAINKKTSGFSTTGLTIIKVITIINLVFCSIGYGLSGVILLIFACILAAEGIPAALIIMLIFILIFAGAVALSIIYYAKTIKSLNSAIGIAANTNISAYASSYVGVICWIAAITGLFSIITAFGFAGKLSALCSCVASACFGMLIFKFKGQMNMLLFSQPTAPNQEKIPTTPPTV